MIPSDVDVVKGCSDMWLELSCRCTKSNGQGVKVKIPNGTILTSTRSNVWKDYGERLSLYYNKTHKNVRVLIRKLKTEDFGTYMCDPTNQDSSEEEDVTKKEVKQGEVPP